MPILKHEKYQQLLEHYNTIDREQTRKDLAYVLSTEEGRRLLVRLQELTAIHAPLALEHLEYQAGRRNVGTEIISLSNEASRENVLKAQAERNAVIEERNEALKQAFQQK